MDPAQRMGCYTHTTRLVRGASGGSVSRAACVRAWVWQSGRCPARRVTSAVAPPRVRVAVINHTNRSVNTRSVSWSPNNRLSVTALSDGGLARDPTDCSSSDFHSQRGAAAPPPDPSTTLSPSLRPMNTWIRRLLLGRKCLTLSLLLEVYNQSINFAKGLVINL